MNRITLLLILSLISLVTINAQYNDLSQPIPSDPETRTGVLKNGMTYYIRHNEQPKERASFYIYQNVGAVLEKKNQNGLAHFLEHMAFNGTEHFPGKKMLNTLEQQGIKFGRDINAYTAHNETVYNISNVPVANEGLLDTCLLVLYDWSDGLLLTEEEIDAERGVISEEWRTRRNASFRTRAQFAPALYNNSIYAKRDVIGSLDVIKNFKPKTIRSFYHNWYRTDLQAISIVGDIDVDEVEKKVIELFSTIPAVKNPKERPSIEIKDKIEPSFVLATDKEVQSSSVSLVIRHKSNAESNLAKWRTSYVRSAFNQMIGARLRELVQKGEAPFLSGSIKISGFVRDYEAFNVSASAKEGEEAEAFKGVLVELERIMRHGFTKSELDRVKTNMLVSSELSYKRRDQATNDSYCKSLKSVYLNNSVLPSSKTSFEFAQSIIPTITVEEVSALAPEWYTDINRTLIVSGPDKEGIHLSKEEAFALFEEVKDMDIKAYVDETTGTDLLSGNMPIGGEIVETKQLEEFDAVEWKLSNGATVVYRFADYEKESVVLNAFSYGGSSIFENNDLPSVSGVGSFVNSFGIGEYDAISYRKLMTGSTASCGFGIGSYMETLSGSSAPNDFEKMLQLLYMRFEMPRFDIEEFENLKERYYASLNNRASNPSTIMSDTLNYILTDGNPRVRKYDSLFLNDIDFQRMVDIYNDRFSDASDFTFIIVGDIPQETVKPLVSKYIGGIKDIDREETWVNRNVNFPNGKQERKIAIPMTEKKSTVIIKMQMDAPYIRESLIHHSILASILRLRFTEEIREKEGGTYGVNVKPGSTRLPKGQLSLSIQFDCDPEKADYLKGLVHNVLDNIKTNVREDDLNKVVLNMKKNNEQSKPHNNYWMSALSTYYITGQNRLEPAYFDDIINNVTTQDIAKAAKQFFENTNEVNVVFYPQESN